MTQPVEAPNRDAIFVDDEIWIAPSLRDQIKPGSWLEVEWRTPYFHELAYAVVRVNEHEAVGLVFQPDQASGRFGFAEDSDSRLIAAVVGIR